MLEFQQVPHQYFKPLNIQTGIVYNIDKEKFPGLTNIGCEPALMMAQTNMDNTESPPALQTSVRIPRNESPPIKPEGPDPVNLTKYDPLRRHFVEKQHYSHNQNEFLQGEPLSMRHSVVNQIPEQIGLPNFESDVHNSKQTSPGQQVYGSIQTNCPPGTQRRLSYGHTQSEIDRLSQINTSAEEARDNPMFYDKDRKHQLQTGLLPSTVLSCLDPFDDSMALSRTDGTLSGVSTPISKTEYVVSSTNWHHPNLNESQTHSLNDRTPILNTSQDTSHKPGQNFQAADQQAYLSKCRTHVSGSNGSLELFTKPTDTLFQTNRIDSPFFVRKPPQFHNPQHATINPRVLAYRRQTLSRKRSAESLHGNQSQNKRPRKDHIEIFGVEGAHQTPASQQLSHPFFPTPQMVKSEENPAESFDEYSCPARPKSEIPNPAQRRNTGTVHYYGSMQSRENPLAKRFNPNFSQQKTSGNPSNHLIQEKNRGQFAASLLHPGYNNVLPTSAYDNNGIHHNPQTSSVPVVNCQPQNIPRNWCVTKDTFQDILYAN